MPRHDAYLRRVLAREARVRGWVPVALEVLAAFFRDHRYRPPAWLADGRWWCLSRRRRCPGMPVLALLHLARRDARPHVLVRTLSRRAGMRVATDRPRHSGVDGARRR